VHSQLSRGTRPLLHIQQLAQVWQETEDEKPNPVTQRVKIIMVSEDEQLQTCKMVAKSSVELFDVHAHAVSSTAVHTMLCIVF
jgi:hypothetical protein